MSLPKDISNLGLARGYQRYVLDLEPVLKGMSKRGMPVTPRRWAEVKVELSELQAAAEKAMRALVPEALWPFSPKQGYKKAPKDTTGLVQRPFFSKARPSEVEMRWVRLEPWKPSTKNLVAYMLFKRHPVPKDYKTERDTANEEELTRLARTTKDFLYSAVLSYRQIGTVLNNHIKNWEPRGDGRVHPTFYYDTGTGQLAARRPNTMNAPQTSYGAEMKKELADKFRSMVEAEDGKTLVSFDYKSFHAQTLAWEAEDEAYLRLAKLDIHSYLTAHLIRHPDRDRVLGWSDGELGDFLRRIKKEHKAIRDGKAKRAILGYGFGMGYRKLYNLNRDSFDSQGDAKRVVDTLNGLFPKADTWRTSVRQRAHDQSYLISRYGCIRWFWEVFTWVNGSWKAGGEDSEAAIAFLPANDAFCHIKEAMLELECRGLLDRYGLVNQIHDALMFECPDALLEECTGTVREVMERPSPVLVNSITPGGLDVKVGVAMGKRWNEMREI